MNRLLRSLMLTLLLTASAHGDSYRLLSVGLYQTNDVLTARIGDASVLAAYVEKLNLAATTYLDAIHGPPEVIQIVVAFRPSGAAKVWIIAPDDKFKVAQGLREPLEKVEPPRPKGGPVAVSILASLWNAPDEKKLTQPGIPAPWQEVLDGLDKSAVLPDDILKKVWAK